jgi:hypothetical protein
MAKIFDSELELFLHSPRGPIYLWLQSKTVEITALAKSQAGREDGRLSRSIRYSIERVPRGLQATIVAPVDYAYFHHEGTRPHIIEPGPRHRFLRFRGFTGVVFTPKVRHPGTRPNHFLTDPMELVLKRT